MRGFIEVTTEFKNGQTINQKVHYSQLKFKQDGTVKLHGIILKENAQEVQQLIKNAQ